MKATLLRIVCLALCSVMLFVLLVGCKKDEADPPEQTGEPNTSDTSENTENGGQSEFHIIGTDVLSSMRVVYYDGASDNVIEAAKKLASTISSLYKVEVMATSDYIREGSEFFKEVEYEILIGKTNRAVETDFYENMLAEDYGYTAVGTKILISGGNDNTITEAVNDFSYLKLVTKKDKPDGVFYSTEYDEYYKGAYAIDTMVLNGVSYREYSIVYPKNAASFEKQLALRVADVIERLTGYMLSVKTDDEIYTGGYEILVGKTNRNAELTAVTPQGIGGRISTSDKLIALYGASVQGHSVAVEEFLSMLWEKSKASKNVEVSINTPIDVDGGDKVSTMSFNLYVSDITEKRSERVTSMIRQYLPDLLGLQEINQSWKMRLEASFSEYYGFIGDSRGGDGSGEANLILYAKERFEVLESGTEWFSGEPGVKMEGAKYVRVFTWAKMKDIKTGEVFLFVNTHLDTANDDVRSEEVRVLLKFLQNHQNIPVLLTGDMNCLPATDPIELLNKSAFVSAFDQTDNVYGKPHIDWIFVTESGITVSQARRCDERIDGEYPSDHYPVYVEMSIEIPEDGLDISWGAVYNDSPDNYLQPTEGKEGEMTVSYKDFLT